MSTIDSLCVVYWALTAMKVVQLALYHLKPKPSSSDKGKLEYNSSMGSFFFVLDTFSGERPASKIPRKEFRDITDPLFHAYIADRSTRPGRTFADLSSARRNCFAEFVQDSGYWIDFGNPHQRFSPSAPRIGVGIHLPSVPVPVPRVARSRNRVLGRIGQVVHLQGRRFRHLDRNLCDLL
mmetsp:Transcript_57270/g.170780  ORF Transcript_57270/g.170780 Transcript_57270/m.170780 type:complete len:180 (-) Transcript_57270:442-981(-)